MYFIGIPIDDYKAGFFGASWMAEEYVNMPDKPPVHMTNGRYGLEEYFETRIVTAVIAGTSMKEYFTTHGRQIYLKGAWDGFLNFVKAFRYFKAKNMKELETRLFAWMEQQRKEHEKEQEELRNDIKDADWWKHGPKKPWER